MNGTTQQRPSRVSVSRRVEGRGAVQLYGIFGFSCFSWAGWALGYRRPDASFTIMIILRPRLYTL